MTKALVLEFSTLTTLSNGATIFFASDQEKYVLLFEKFFEELKKKGGALAPPLAQESPKA